MVQQRVSLLRLGLLLAISSTVNGFQFMKNLKMPTYDPHEEAVKERFGEKKLVVLTGTSSGLGRKTAKALLRSGEYHVIGAVRDLDKMEAVAEMDGFEMDRFTPMYCEMNSFDSVRAFCRNVETFRLSKPIDRLICNAGVYQPTLPYPKWSFDNHEQTMQINFLSHMLMISQLMTSMMESSDPRVVMVGSVTGNDNTVGGGGVYPIADLHELEGFKAGFDNPVAMADGYGFIGAKAYKDSKLCLMMMANFLHTKYHKLTKISFSSMYPGCIAESPLFREKRPWFRKYFPIFMKFITGGYVGEDEAGQRLFQVAHDPRCAKSGVYWSWNGGPREGRGVAAIEKAGQISGGGGAGGGWDSIFENDQSSKVLDVETAIKLFQYTTDITKAEWPELKQIRSPCPTLNVIGAVTKGMVKREELRRMKEMGRPGMDGSSPVTPVEAETVKVVAVKSPVLLVDKVATGVLSNTVGRVAKGLGKKVLGEIPETALKGSYAPTKADLAAAQASIVVPQESALEQNEALFAEEVKPQLIKVPAVVDAEDEALFQELYNQDTVAKIVDNSEKKNTVQA